MPRISKEIKDQIVEANKDLTGTINSRSKKLSIKFRISIPTIVNIIRSEGDTIKIAKITDEERENIKRVYNSCMHLDNRSQKIAYTSKECKRSRDAVRKIVFFAGNVSEKLFDYKTFPF